jgi:hypothetical protein
MGYELLPRAARDMQRTDLAVTVRRESLEKGVGNDQHLPKAVDRILVIAGVNSIAIEANRIDHFDRGWSISTSTPIAVNIRRNSAKKSATRIGRRASLRVSIRGRAIDRGRVHVSALAFCRPNLQGIT